MRSKSLLNYFGSISDLQFSMLFTNDDEELCSANSISSCKRTNRSLDDFQIFTDHLKLNEHFKNTLYYGKLPSSECPSLPLTDVTLELFTKTVPNGGLDVLDMHYAASVSRKACISPCSMILAIMYLDQLRHKNPEYLQNVASCDLFLISMLVASKFLYDNGEEDEVFNAEWACSANMDIKDLNNLEREFLAALNWEAFVRPSEFFNLVHKIECKIALREMSKRGWCTYTDISVLSQSSVAVGIITILVDNVIKVIVIIGFAYVAFVFTLFGASAICQRCIPLMQGTLQLLVTDSTDTYSIAVSDSTTGSEMIISETVTIGDASYENLSHDWFGRPLSSNEENETGSLNSHSYTMVSASRGRTEQATLFLGHGYNNYCKAKTKLCTFTNESVDGLFMPSSVMNGRNCVIVHIKPSAVKTAPQHRFCPMELSLWLSSIYNIGYSFGICQNYFSETLKA